MSASKFVVTGATGHMGRSVVLELAKHGEVVALSRSGAVPEAPYAAVRSGNVRPLAVDVASEACVEQIRAELGAQVALIHLAGWHPPRTASTDERDRRELVRVNVQGTMRVLEAARRLDGAAVSCVVYASTFEVYGIPRRSGQVLETDRVEPVTDYGASKLAGEDHLFAFAYEEQVRCVALRLPAIYGPGEVTSRALPNFLRCVARGERPRVAGAGTDLRDQIHARDAALAVACAVQTSASGIFNVADGERHSILDLASAAMRVAGMSGAPESVPADRPAYQFHMSIAKARAELGFEPQISLLDGMAEQLAWLRSLPG